MKWLGAARGRSMFFVGLITGMAAMLGEAQQNLPAGTAVVGQFRYSDVDLPVRGERPAWRCSQMGVFTWRSGRRRLSWMFPDRKSSRPSFLRRA